MKRIFALLLCFAVSCLLLAGCGAGTRTRSAAIPDGTDSPSVTEPAHPARPGHRPRHEEPASPDRRSHHDESGHPSHPRPEPRADRSELRSRPMRMELYGMGSVLLPADTATLQLCVETEAATMEEAMTENDAKALKFREVAATYGTLTETYRSAWPKDPGEGYAVSRSYQLKTKELDRLDEILTALAQNGVSRIYGVSYECEGNESARQAALNAAIADAKQTAESFFSQPVILKIQECGFAPLCGYSDGSRIVRFEARVQVLFTEGETAAPSAA